MGYRLIFIWLIGFCLHAQDVSVKELVNDWYKGYFDKDFKKIVPFSYPEIFNYISVNELEQTIQNSFDNEATKMTYLIENPEFQFSQTFEVNGMKIIVMSYLMSLSVQYKSELSQDMIEYIKKDLKQRMESFEVIYEASNNTFFINRQDINLIINNQHTNGEWKILNFSPNQKGFAHIFFGEDFNSKIGF